MKNTKSLKPQNGKSHKDSIINTTNTKSTICKVKGC